MKKVPYAPLLIALSLVALILTAWALTRPSNKSEFYVNGSKESYAVSNSFLSSTVVNPDSYYQKYSLNTGATSNDPNNPPRFGGVYPCDAFPTTYWKQAGISCTGAYAGFPSDSTGACQATGGGFFKYNKFVVSYAGTIPNSCPADMVTGCAPVAGGCLDNFDSNYQAPLGSLASSSYIYGADALNWKVFAMPLSSAVTTIDMYIRNPWSKAYLSLLQGVYVFTNDWSKAAKFRYTAYFIGSGSAMGSLSCISGTSTLPFRYSMNGSVMNMNTTGTALDTSNFTSDGRIVNFQIVVGGGTTSGYVLSIPSNVNLGSTAWSQTDLVFKVPL